MEKERKKEKAKESPSVRIGNIYAFDPPTFPKVQKVLFENKNYGKS